MTDANEQKRTDRTLDRTIHATRRATLDDPPDVHDPAERHEDVGEQQGELRVYCISAERRQLGVRTDAMGCKEDRKETQRSRRRCRW